MVVICKLRNELLEKPNLNTLILGFQPLKLWESKFILFKSPCVSLCYGRPSKLIHISSQNSGNQLANFILQKKKLLLRYIVVKICNNHYLCSPENHKTKLFLKCKEKQFSITSPPRILIYRMMQN